MNTITSFADDLRKMADRLQEIDQDLRLPCHDVTLAEALKRVRMIIGDDATCGIGLHLSCFGGKVKPEWNVWDGSATYTGPTLDRALNKFVDFHSGTPPADSVSDIDQIIQQARVPF